MLILASSSPRRAELLRCAGIAFDVQPADVPEVRRDRESPVDYARRLALEKARAVATLRPNDFVLGADTDVCVDDRIVGKPRDAHDAAAMLRLLSGRWHQVTTGVCLIAPRPLGTPVHRAGEHVEHSTTRVRFDTLTGPEIAAYIATGEPMDKAGAYAIQGMASRWVSALEGDYGTVMGLPVALVYRMLRQNGAL